jgi:choline dehydrogenase-like flavoprotein
VFADARSVPRDSALTADVCIVGAGPAGITLARELIGSPLAVTVLESGGFELDARTQDLYDGPSVGLPYGSLIGPRLRYFGGTTNHWGGICRPFDEADFEAREGIPFTGWPIRKADVDPFYGAAASICRVPSPRWELGYWLERDPLRPLPFGGDRISNRVAQVVPESSRAFGKNYREELRKAANVTVYLNANAMGLDTDEPGSTVTSTRVATLSGTRFSVGARLFVLATGAVENARLLLVSKSGRWPTGIGNHNDVVGRFFLEHPRFVAGVVAPADPRMGLGFYNVHRVGDATLRGYVASSKELQLAEGLLDVQIRPEPFYGRSAEGAADSPEIASLKSLIAGIRRREKVLGFGRHVGNVVADVMTWERLVIPGPPLPVPYPEVLGKLLSSTPSEAEELLPELLGDVATVAYARGRGRLDSILLRTRFEQAPNPDSRVLLIEERDALGMPRVALDWRLSDADRRTVRRTLEVMGEEVGRAGIGRLKILHDEADTGWPDDLGGGQHLMGTTRMSDDPKQGVVDRNLRVHDTSNLFIAGCSVFPTPGGATPTMMLVTLTLRLARHVKVMMLT